MIHHLYLAAVIYGPALAVADLTGAALIHPTRTRKGGMR